MINIDENSCIGCGFCYSEAKEVFTPNDEGLASLIENYDFEKYNTEINTAKDGCPTGAITIENEIA